eukprot:s3188_g3.t2
MCKYCDSKGARRFAMPTVRGVCRWGRTPCLVSAKVPVVRIIGFSLDSLDGPPVPLPQWRLFGSSWPKWRACLRWEGNGAKSCRRMAEKDEVEAGDQHRILADQVKTNQRASRPFAKAWRSYCDSHGDGFYDPARHGRCNRALEIRLHCGLFDILRHPKDFLEDFLKTAADKHADSDDEDSSDSSSRSRSRRRSRRRRRHGTGRHRTRHRRRRRDRGRTRRKGRRRRSSSSSLSGELPTRKAAIKGAERAVAAALKDLEALRAAKPLDEDEAAQVEEEQKQQKEVEQKFEKLKAEIEAEREEKIRETQRKIEEPVVVMLVRLVSEEKATRLKEAEDKLNEAIAKHIRDAESKLRSEAQDRIDKVKKKAEATLTSAMQEAPSKIESSWALQMTHLEQTARDARAALDALRMKESKDK